MDIKDELLLCHLIQEKVSALENQANQLGLQATQECERLATDRTLTLQMLQKVTGSESRCGSTNTGVFLREKRATNVLQINTSNNLDNYLSLTN